MPRNELSTEDGTYYTGFAFIATIHCLPGEQLSEGRWRSQRLLMPPATRPLAHN